MTIRIHFIALFLLINSIATAHGDAEKNILEFKENKGQWDSHVLYRTDIKGGALFLEEKGFSYKIENTIIILK